MGGFLNLYFSLSRGALEWATNLDVTMNLDVAINIHEISNTDLTLAHKLNNAI